MKMGSALGVRAEERTVRAELEVQEGRGSRTSEGLWVPKTRSGASEMAHLVSACHESKRS